MAPAGITITQRRRLRGAMRPLARLPAGSPLDGGTLPPKFGRNEGALETAQHEVQLPAVSNARHLTDLGPSVGGAMMSNGAEADSAAGNP
jgi:hypothetical protein